MVKVLLILLLALISNSAMAKWIYVAGDNSFNKYYFDISTLKRTGNIVRVWTLTDRKSDVDGELSSKILLEFDCKLELDRFISGTAYKGSMGGGGVSQSYNKVGNWDPIVPDTVSETTFKYACGKLTINEAALTDIPLIKWSLIYTGDKSNTYAVIPESSLEKTKKRPASKIVNKKSIVKIWTLIDYKENQSLDGSYVYISTKNLTEIDCNKNNFRFVKAANYSEKMASGNVTSSYDSQDWSSINPGSASSEMKKVACGEMSATIIATNAKKVEAPAVEAPPESNAEVNAAVARNVDLSYWQKNDPRIFDEAVTVDEKLRDDPKYSGVSLDDRFVEVVRIVKEQEIKKN